jgi:RNA polymerase sigma-70 factor (ECF subfamily)
MDFARALPLQVLSDAKSAAKAAAEAVARSAERDLLRRAQAGDADAFGQVVNKHWKRAYWTAYDVLYDHDGAQDAAQDAMVKVHRALQTYDLGRDFSSWLYRIVLNVAIDLKRKRNRDKSKPTDRIGEMVDARRAIVEDTEKAARIEQVELVLSRLPDKYRIPLSLKDLEDMTVEEIAKLLDVSYSTVRWRLHKARKLFREGWVRLQQRSERRDERREARARPGTDSGNIQRDI